MKTQISRFKFMRQNKIMSDKDKNYVNYKKLKFKDNS